MMPNPSSSGRTTAGHDCSLRQGRRRRCASLTSNVSWQERRHAKGRSQCNSDNTRSKSSRALRPSSAFARTATTSPTTFFSTSRPGLDSAFPLPGAPCGRATVRTTLCAQLVHGANVFQRTKRRLSCERANRNNTPTFRRSGYAYLWLGRQLQNHGRRRAR